ncbi:MAG: hypothetical protein JWM35_1294 [Verrucomicrobia bacterium]|nr:hypothetical protein [Verrucomicrobiota bacterium]
MFRKGPMARSPRWRQRRGIPAARTLIVHRLPTKRGETGRRDRFAGERRNCATRRAAHLAGLARRPGATGMRVGCMILAAAVGGRGALYGNLDRDLDRPCGAEGERQGQQGGEKRFHESDHPARHSARLCHGVEAFPRMDLGEFTRWNGFGSEPSATNAVHARAPASAFVVASQSP